MKHRLEDDNIRALFAAMLRLAMTEFGMPHECPIRKCRRDGSCTGPLLSRDRKTQALTIVADPRLSHTDVNPPICRFLRTESEQLRITQRIGEMTKAVGDNPDMPVIEAGRAVGARKWLVIGDFRA